MSLAYRLARGGMTSIYNAFLDTPPILNTEQYFPEAPAFTKRWQEIREEALAIAGDIDKVPRFHEIMSEQYQLSAHGEKEWRMFVLRAYGLDLSENMKLCPVLADLVRANPKIKSASLSFLAPGKQVPTHTGPFRGITRFYMGVQVPLNDQGEPGVTLTIDDQAYKLGNGESLLWDDTYPHSVMNDTEEWRIALLLDVYRENMSSPLRGLTNMIISLAQFSIRTRKVFPEEFA